MHYPTRRPLPTLEDRIVAHLAKAPATRSQLCEALDTSRTNLGRALTTLLDEGSVTPVRTNAPGRGRPTQLLTLNSSAVHCVGLNVTRTSCAGVMLSRNGTVLAAVHIVSPTSPSLQLSLEQTCEALAASAARQGIDTSTVRAVGVGVPIPMGRNARLSSDAYPTMEELSELTRRWWDPLPVVDNTVRMAALAEALWGAGADMSSFIYLRLSGGVGGCVVSDFRLVGGAGGLAGELGHMTVGTNDSPCACGKRGCLETLASVPALCERAGVADIAQLRAAVLSGDTRAREALERAAQAVGYVLGSAALLINPRPSSLPAKSSTRSPPCGPTSRPPCTGSSFPSWSGTSTSWGHRWGPWAQLRPARISPHIPPKRTPSQPTAPRKAHPGRRGRPRR